jgi:tyrosine-protein phosphatase SIW14
VSAPVQAVDSGNITVAEAAISQIAEFRPRRCRRWLRRALLLALVLTIGAGAYVGFYRYHLKRFATIREGVFYRVAQPTEIGFQVLDKYYGAKTVVSLQLFDFRLHRGWFDPGSADGRQELEFVEQLGMKHVQWPMGDEQCWPWLDPYQLEAFYRLVDDPANHPIVVHCMGGRHRTGTISALYRIEYDRWPVEDALREMYSFDFGGAIPTQEHNLRAYVPRPEPDAEAWHSLAAAFSPHFSEAPPGDYRELVRKLRGMSGNGSSRDVISRYISQGGRFALPLADRLIDSPQDPLAQVATTAANQELIAARDRKGRRVDTDVFAAVSLIADYGSPAMQKALADLVRTEAERAGEPTPLYETVVSALTSRYTRNRIAFLRPVLEDVRSRIGANTAPYRYCDSVVYFIGTITDQFPLLAWSYEKQPSQGQAYAQKWYTENADDLLLAQRTAPRLRYGVRQGDGAVEEDLSKMRR